MKKQNLRTCIIFAQNFKKMKQEKQVTFREMSADLGYTENALKSWAAAISMPRAEAIDCLAEYFNCRIADFFKE